jgi:hypothetical protein
MDYIVSPWLIYLCGVSEGFQCLLVVLGILGLTLGIPACMGFPGTIEYRKKFLFIPITALVLVFLAILVPSKETMLQMLVAKNLTYTNADKIVKEGKVLKDELKQDVIDIILAVNKEKK